MRPLLVLSLFIMTLATSPARELLVYFGTYTKTSKGIYAGRFDTATGQLGELSLVAEAVNPSFLALSPDRRFLYAVSESEGLTFGGKRSGAVNAYAIDATTGVLTPVNIAASAGRGPCHLNVTPDGKAVLVANYSEGTVALLPVLPDGGVGAPASVDQHEGKSIHPARQQGPYAHSVNLTADGRFAFVANLGTDRIYTYRVDTAAASLAPASPASVVLEPGSGPRHLALSPDERRVYVINELASTVTTFSFDAQTGALAALQTVTALPPGFTGKNTAAEVVVHPNGRFVYGSNRGHDSIAVFAADAAGTLSLVEHVSTLGRTPRNFNLTPDGRWLIAANQDANSIVIYSVDAATGRLVPTGQTVTLGAPVCVRFY
jgi:6-phosphogluconolactonase